MPEPLGGEVYVSLSVTSPSLPFFERLRRTLLNTLGRRRKVSLVVGDVIGRGAAWTTGVIERGYYEGVGERSFSVKLYGRSSDVLDEIAVRLADDFSQLNVLVVDFNRQETRLIVGRLGKTG